MRPGEKGWQDNDIKDEFSSVAMQILSPQNSNLRTSLQRDNKKLLLPKKQRQ